MAAGFRKKRFWAAQSRLAQHGISIAPRRNRRRAVGAAQRMLIWDHMDRSPSLDIRPCGDSALLVQFGTAIDPAINARVLAFDRALARAKIAGLVESVPCYASVLVHYDCRVIGFDDFVTRLQNLKIDENDGAKNERRHWRVPVVYGGEFGPDLDAVARACNLSAQEVVAAHLGTRFRVAMLGFTPGFAYLFGLDPRLHLPRKPVPVARAGAGSISIAAGQAAIQSLPGPTGWHVIGRTPVQNFVPHRDPVFLFEPGDEISFMQIDAPTFHQWTQAAAAGAPIAERSP